MSDKPEKTDKTKNTDRSALLRMAGNIASGITDSYCRAYGMQNSATCEMIAVRAVAIARAIIAEVDKT